MKVVVASIDFIAFCIWMFVVFGIGNTSEFALGPVWFHILAWGLPILMVIVTLPVLPKKQR